jgi:putative FmdB family regulatory protein
LPTYEYACTACGHRLEAVQKFSDDALTVCPDCSGALRKVYGAVGIAFKGSGFYKTDSRADGKKSAAVASSGSESSSSESKSADSSSTASTSTSTSTSGDGAKSGSSDKPAKESKDTKKAAAAST